MSLFTTKQFQKAVMQTWVDNGRPNGLFMHAKVNEVIMFSIDCLGEAEVVETLPLLGPINTEVDRVVCNPG